MYSLKPKIKCGFLESSRMFFLFKIIIINNIITCDALYIFFSSYPILQLQVK